MSQTQEYTLQVHNTLEVPATVLLISNGSSNSTVNPGQWLQYGSPTPFTSVNITAPSSGNHPPLRHAATLATNTYYQGQFKITPNYVIRGSNSPTCNTSSPPPSTVTTTTVMNPVATTPSFGMPGMMNGNTVTTNGSGMATMTGNNGYQQFAPQQPGYMNFSFPATGGQQQPMSQQPSGGPIVTPINPPMVNTTGGTTHMYTCTINFQPDGSLNMCCRPTTPMPSSGQTNFGGFGTTNNVGGTGYGVYR